MKYLVPIIPITLAFLGILVGLSIALFFVRKESRQLRESPLTRNLLRPPGYSLRAKIYDLSEQMSDHIMMVMMIPLVVYAVHISQSYFGSEPETPLRWVIAIGAAIALSLYLGKRLISLAGQLKNFGLGLEGELATGEELNQLMLDGCRVFHDIPFQYGNIDHVVVSQSAVFSVNTKMLGKLKNGQGNTEITVDHHRDVIRFPDREVRIPVEQLETEKKWLSQYLSNAVGQPVNVEPILALPGWYIKERIGRSSIYVINPYKPKKFFVQQNRQILSPDLVQRIAHQLEQLCRDIQPSYREERERWESNS